MIDRRTLYYRLLLIALPLLALGGGIFSYLLLSDYEILEKGHLLPYTSGFIYKVRFGGWLTLYLEKEVRPSMDILNAYLLAGIAFISFTFSIIHVEIVKNRSSKHFWFFLMAFFGMTYLVADETFAIHENIGHMLQFLTKLPVVKRPDDLIILSFTVPAALFCYHFRSVLLSSRKAFFLFALGFLIFIMSALSDILTLPGEEILEVLASACLFAGMINLGLHSIREA